MYVCMYVTMYACMYVHTYVCMTFVCMYVRIYVCMYVHSCSTGIYAIRSTPDATYVVYIIYT